MLPAELLLSWLSGGGPAPLHERLSGALLPLQICAGAAFVCWALSVATREYSWVDRLWSLVPVVYVGVFAWRADFADARLNLMLALVAAWGARLTFNYARKGGYRPGGEDYRWGELRKRMPGWAYQGFNVLFIAGYQNFLLFLLALPAWQASLHPSPLGWLDAVAALAFVVLLGGETVADQQQWAFHQAKKAGVPAAVQRGFVDTGLWAWSRHPNFFCEQGLWWAVYAFSVAAGAPVLNVSLVGPVLLVLLFAGSTTFTELLTAAKYPAYADYQRRVSRLVPWPPRRA